MGKDRGVALILALLVLSFLTVLGSALLTTSTIDIWISDNYKSATQTLYLAEAAIDDGRETLRTSGVSLSQLLRTAAGPDYQLMTQDDEPLISSRQLIDVTGMGSGFYEVWLRNDNADGAASLTDSNEIVSLVGMGKLGTSRKTIEITAEKGKFPESQFDSRLQSISGLEGLAGSITRNATDVNGGSSISQFGSPEDYRVVVINGDLALGPGSSYGLLLVRGELHITGDITWNGLILVIGQGVLRWNAGASGNINGGLFLARTRDPSGLLLSAPEDVMYTITDPAQVKAANRSFPYNPIVISEK